MKNNRRIERLKKKENRLVSKGSKAVDEGRDKKADRILGRAAKTENKRINLQEKKEGKAKNKKSSYLDLLGPNAIPYSHLRDLENMKKTNSKLTPKRKGGLVKKKK